MKNNVRLHPGARRKRGFVLILVLGILVIVTLLVVGFLAHALSQVKSVTSYRAQTDSLLLSDVAVNIVKSQIDDATSQPSASWASQPGAIRSFSDASTSSTIYKLYSSSSLTSTNPSTDIPKDLPTATDANDWNSNALWTDLNAPVQRSDGTYAYPIIDVVNDTTDLPTGTTTPGPFASGSFNVDSTSTINPIGATRNAGTSNFPLPMPVHWLYILKQGQIIAPDSTSTATTATFIKSVTNSHQPLVTAANPIVGRVAFWTDDDTCKVNVNTAAVSGTAVTGTATAINTFWDTPRFTATDDYALSASQPVNLEFQRYGGHPATTTLALALPELATSGTVTTANLANILNLTPSYANGGSQGGTVLSSASGTFSLPSRRLYASVNELLFNPPGATGTSTPRNTSSLTRTQLEAAKFFITAHSRAPELNLFGLPRVSIWPSSALANTSANTYLTATDSLMNFCATTYTGTAYTSTTTPGGPGSYYFTRTPYVASSPGNTALLTGSQSTVSDANLSRNVALMNYLDTLTSDSMTPLPGDIAPSGNSFDYKYTPSGASSTNPLGMRQILTEIFDYIRITNSRDPGLDPNLNTSLAGPVPYSAATAYDNGILSGVSGYGQILPTQLGSYSTLNWGTYGYGRSEGIPVNAHIFFMGVGQGPAVSSPQTWTSYTAVNSWNVTGTSATTNSAPITNPNGYMYTNAPAQLPTFATNDSNGPEINEYYTPTGTLNANNHSSPSVEDIPTNSAIVKAPVPLVPPPGDTAVEAIIVFNFFDPAMGYARDTQMMTFNSSGLIGTSGMTVSPSAGNTVPVSQTLFQHEFSQRFAGQTGIDYANIVGANPGSLGGLQDFRGMALSALFGNGWSAYSPIINMPTNGTFYFSGGTFTFTGQFGAGGTLATGTVTPRTNTYTFKFPPATLPVPAVSTTRSMMGTGSDAGDRFALANASEISESGSPIPGAYKRDNNGPICDYIDPNADTIISMVPNAVAGYGDYRMLAQPTNSVSAFTNHPNYNSLVNGANPQRLAMDIMWPSGALYPTSTIPGGTSSTVTLPHGLLVSGANYFQQNITQGNLPTSSPNANTIYGSSPFVPITQSTAPTAGNNGVTPPDFDNGFGQLPDGPFINKPDEGGVYPASSGFRPYYDNQGAAIDSTITPNYFFSPQRQVPSPVMFGSLPTGAPVTTSTATLTPKPWQTLLFQPGAPGHAGLTDPKDEYLLDLFWMPQVLPYAISEPFSTAGKVNLNYQILPFTYIDRSTAIQSVLASEKVAVIPTSAAGTYKMDQQTLTTPVANSTGMGVARYPINTSETNGTLAWFQAKFKTWSIFKSAAEICDVYLVPSTLPAGESPWTVTYSATSGTYTTNAQGYWYGSDFGLVGDNTREKPYADIYSRVTTKSNVYTVYYRVQTLKNPIGTTVTTWNESPGNITGEYRGSATIERYLDPNVAIPDYAAQWSTLSAIYGDLGDSPFLDGYVPTTYGTSGSPTSQLYYKWRVVENNRFAP